MDIEEQGERENVLFALAQRFRDAVDPCEVKQLGDEIGRFIFGE